MKFFTDAFEQAKTPEENARDALVESFTTAQEAANLLARVEKDQSVLKSARERNRAIGKMEEEEGIYIGTINFGPEDSPFEKTYRVYAAPEDLKDKNGKSTWEFHEAAKELAKRKDWHGHPGSQISNFDKLAAALEAGTYGGEWFIPDIATLTALESVKDLGDLKGTFVTTYVRSGDVVADCYWSSTPVGAGASNLAISFCDRSTYAFAKTNQSRLSCRPCRAVPV
jgi:hypothetical protein